VASEQQWKDKYLDLIDESEQQQQRFAEQQAILHRAIGRLGIAAEGLDDNLDGLLLELRSQLRGQQPAELAPILNKIDDAVVHADDSRSERVRNCLAALTGIGQQLESISKDKDASKSLKQYRKGLKQRVEKQQQYGDMLTELADLQALVIASISQDSASFWGKLTGKKEAQLELGEPQEGDDPQADGSQAQVESTTEQAAQAGSDDISAYANTEAIKPGKPEPTAVEPPLEGQFLSRTEIDQELEASFDRPRHEPAFSRISNHITRVLTELLEGIEPSSCVQQKALQAKVRIAKGLNWFELVPTLEDIRDLIFQAYMAAEQGFEQYLKNIDGELEQIAEILGLALQSQQQAEDSQQSLQQSMHNELDNIGTAVSTANDVEALKTVVNDHIGQIKQALANHNSNTDGAGIFAQLKSLLSQVQTMDAEAKQQQQELEQERNRANTDALTGLPNREAYTSRSFLEQERCLRYGHPLVVAVCDVDHFKKFNDSYGHQTGDRVLKLIAKAISQRLRKVDFMARYGGEEFVVLLPETELTQALALMDKIRESLASAPLRFKDEPVQITISMGLAEFGEGDTIDKVFARADKALYQAKADGRNCCRLG